MSVSAAVIGILPESPALSPLEELAGGQSLSHLHFARTPGEAAEVLPGSDYVIVSADSLSEECRAQLLALREGSDAVWILLHADEAAALPGWARSLNFTHQYRCPEGGPCPPPRPRSAPHLLQAGDLTLDTRSGRLQAGCRQVQLTPREARLLSLFLRRPEEVLSKEELLRGCWGETEHPINLVQVTIRRLRQKLASQAGRPELIENCRGFGYRLNLEV